MDDIKKNKKQEYKEQQLNNLNKYQQVVVDLLQHYKTNTQDILEYLAFSSRFHNYSIRNQILLNSQNPNAVFVGGYEKFIELGYHVKKGEKGMKIFVPVPATFFYNPETKQWKPLKQATNEDKQHIKNKQFDTKQVLHFKLGTVFDISQTNCPVEDYPKIFDMGYASEEHRKVGHALELYCEHYLNCKVETRDVKSIALNGYYEPKRNMIVLSDKLNDTQRMSTLAHEIGHAIMHSDINMLEEKTTEQIEVEADAISIMITNALGIETIAKIDKSQQRHIAANFKKFTSDTENNESPLLDILSNVNKAFNRNITDIKRVVQQVIDQRQEQIQDVSKQLDSEDPTVKILWSDNKEFNDIAYRSLSIKDAENLFNKCEKNQDNDETRFKITYHDNNKYDVKDLNYMGVFKNGAEGGLINHIANVNENNFEIAQTKEDINQSATIQTLVKDLWNAYDYNCIAEIEHQEKPNIELISKYYDNIDKREEFFLANGYATKIIPAESEQTQEKRIPLKR